MTDADPKRIPLQISQAALDARARAEDRAGRAGGVHPSPGQLWTRTCDGATMRLAGMKGGGARITCGMLHEDGTVIEVDIDTLVDEWTFAGCDHDAACCTIHGTHTSPHMGCILR